MLLEMGEALLLRSHCCWSSILYLQRAAAAIRFGSIPTIAGSISSRGKRKTCPRRSLIRPQASSKPLPQQQHPEFDNNDDKDNNESSNGTFSSSDDLNFLLKLVAGSFGGAAVIKYGSALFPEITRPNIYAAMLMVGMPVLVSVLLLIKQSSIRTQNQDPY